MGATALEHYGPWTVEEVLELAVDGQRHELVDGSLVVSPAPGVPHQRISFRLARQLDDACPDGFEVLEAVNVRLGNGRLLIPDVAILTVPGSNATVLDAAEVVLVAEVVSPSTAAMDRVLKPHLYATAGIRHYLRVDTDGPDGPRISVHRLDQGAYVLCGEAGPGSPLTLDVPFAVRLDPAALHTGRR